MPKKLVSFKYYAHTDLPSRLSLVFKVASPEFSSTYECQNIWFSTPELLAKRVRLLVGLVKLLGLQLERDSTLRNYQGEEGSLYGTFFIVGHSVGNRYWDEYA
jgi:hypothetical protein